MIFIFICSFFIFSNAQDNYLDLGYGYDAKTLVIPVPGMKKFRYTERFAGEELGTFMAFNNFEVAEHAGTHIDAPYHFNKEGLKLGYIPLERFFANGVYINVTEDTAGDYNYRLPVSKLEQWESENGPMPQKSVVFVDFGWGDRYPNFEEYFGKTGAEYPGLSGEASEWLANSDKVLGVGVDTASPDAGAKPPYSAHLNFLSKNKFILENVNLNSDQIPKVFKVFIMPIKLMDGTGGPVRIIAKF